ncbi:MAG: DUF5996 family protein, partial [Actinomycetota bacterium]
MPKLPDDWQDTRSTLQAYGQALTAFPRAAGIADDRWTHVAMGVTSTGLVASPTPLADGEELTTSIDLVEHRIVVQAGEDVEHLDISGGPSPADIGNAILAIADKHGSTIDVDPDRIAGSETLPYDREHAERFLAAATYAANAFGEMNGAVSGEVTGPHLWPHGFDIATEWYSDKLVPYGDSEAPAQIAVGFYPANESYFYANPWPFEDAWAEKPPVEGSTWHLDGWQGAVLDPEGVDGADIVAFGSSVHELARDSLS